MDIKLKKQAYEKLYKLGNLHDDPNDFTEEEVTKFRLAHSLLKVVIYTSLMKPNDIYNS